MPGGFNPFLDAEVASLRALGAVRRRLSARDRLARERRQVKPPDKKPWSEPMPRDEWGADD